MQLKILELKKKYLHKRNVLVFKQWSAKAYSVFNSIGKLVSILALNIATTKVFLPTNIINMPFISLLIQFFNIEINKTNIILINNSSNNNSNNNFSEKKVHI